MKARVPKHGNPTGYVVVETDATVGATIGANLYNADGSLFDLAAFAASLAVTPATPAPIGPLTNAADDTAAAAAGVAIGALYRNGSVVQIRIT